MLHVIAKSNARRRIFHRDGDFCNFLFRLRLRLRLHASQCWVHHYALMHTHVHLLIWCEDTGFLATLMKSVLVSYHHYYERTYEYHGNLWHGRYRSIVIEEESHFLQCGRYIELNPVHAGVCKDPGRYRWTSYHHYAFGRPDSIVRPRFYEGVWREGVADVEYQQFVRAGIDMDYQRMKKLYEREEKEALRGGV